MNLANHDWINKHVVYELSMARSTRFKGVGGRVIFVNPKFPHVITVLVGYDTVTGQQVVDIVNTAVDTVFLMEENHEHA